MYGDTQVIRRQASRLREQGVELRSMADRLVAQVEQLAWTGRAADTLRTRIRDRAGRLREAAGRHDTAAESLERHGAQVDAVKDTIAATQRRTAALQSDARARLGAPGSGGIEAPGAGLVAPHADPDDLQVAAFTPPAPGHRDWLDVDLPGL